LQSNIFITLTGCTEKYLKYGYNLLLRKLAEDGFSRMIVCQLYQGASDVIEWATRYCANGTNGRHLTLITYAEAKKKKLRAMNACARTLGLDYWLTRDDAEGEPDEADNDIDMQSQKSDQKGDN
jgi:hypothetical protein